METKRSLQSIPDDELLQRLAELTSQSRRVEVDIVAHIAEVDERKLYAREAFSSMFVYCREVLHLSEHEAYLRIAVARASREHPMLLTMLADGRLHLTAIDKVAPHLTHENRDGLLERATHRSKRQLEELIAEIAPRPDVPVVIRKLPERRLATTGPVAVPARPEGATLGFGPEPTLKLHTDPMGELGPDLVGASESGARRDNDARHASPPPVSASVIQSLSPGRYKVQFTASAELRQKLERLRVLMGSGVDGDLAAVIEQAVTEKLERLEARRYARTRSPRAGSPEPRTKATRPSPSPLPEKTPFDPSPSSRHIPAAVRRAVCQRDGGRCRYVDDQGRRCKERDRLEFHHRHPFGLGGENSVANIALMCRAHNAYLAECDFGRAAMARHRRPRRPISPEPTG
jgi:hypothetical protein